MKRADNSDENVAEHSQKLERRKLWLGASINNVALHLRPCVYT